MGRYNTPGAASNPVASSVGEQMNTSYYDKRALIDAQKEQYFTQLASVAAMPRNFGKTIRRYHYLPLLDDRNDNDQGINGAGATIANGNLYGSSKDTGTITGRLPALTENGGRVNRVGYTRITVEGSIEKFGFFDEFSQESLDFDSDAELDGYLRREMILAANEMSEDALQIDLLAAAGTIRFAGVATSDATITGEGANKSVVDFEDLVRLSIDLDNNRTPKQTTVISGTRFIDTRTVDYARIMYVGTEMLPTLKKMTDNFNNQAFIPVNQYAASGEAVRGEVGTIDQFRIVVVPEMQHWAGLGADEGTNEGYRVSDVNGTDKYDIYPLLVVGDEAFSTIGFQTDGEVTRFTIIRKDPGVETADRNDPYGELGFNSIKWYYGFLALRPERIALIKSVAEM